MDNVFVVLFYGEDYIFFLNLMGNESMLLNIIMDDFKVYYVKYIILNFIYVYVVGVVFLEMVIEIMKGWVEGWFKKVVSLFEFKVVNIFEIFKVYFYDVFGVK